MIPKTTLRRMVEGQIADFLIAHPGAVGKFWSTKIDGKTRLAHSLTKRIVGEIHGKMLADARRAKEKSDAKN